MARSLHLQSGWNGPRRGSERRAWEAVRKLVLERDHYECMVRLPGICTGHANTVDHIRAIAEGGARLDPANLRAACAPCNRHLGAVLGGKRLQMQSHRFSRVW